MTNNETLRRHAELVERMASTLGIDMEEKMMEGKLQGDQLGDAVLRCTSCSNPEGCERWLDMQTGHAQEAPGICRNADMFTQLKMGRRA